MSNTPVFLDVNIPMYAAGRPHEYKESCAWIMGEIAQGRITAVIIEAASEEEGALSCE